MGTQPTKEAIIGTFIIGRNDSLDFLQLATNNGGNVFGWIDSGGFLRGTLAATNEPGGSDTQVQFNNAGILDGDANFTWSKSTQALTITGSISSGAISSVNATPATALANQSSPVFTLAGTVWNGAISLVDKWTVQVVVNSGVLPGQTLVFTCNQGNGAVSFNTTLVCGQLNCGAVFTGGNVNLTSAGATAIANISSFKYSLISAWWDGATTHNSTTSIQDFEGAGNNPTATTQISNSGAFAWAGVSIVGALASQTLTVTAATPTGTSGQVGFGTTAGFGAGSAGTAVTTTTKGGGTGPTTPQTVVNYLEIDIAGVKYWIGLSQ